MRNSYNKNWSIYGLLMLVFITSAAMAAQDRSKKISKSYQLKKDTEVRISNQFGLVHIETRQGSRFDVDIEITVSAKNESRSENILNSIKIEFTDDVARGSLEIKTHIDEHKDDGSFSIDYHVTMPAANALSLKNRFGNVYLERLENNAELSVQFGQLKTGVIDGNAQINLEFGSSENSVESIKDGKIVLKHTKLELEKATNIDVESQFSNMSVGSVGSLDIKGKHGDFDIGTVDRLKADLAFSGLRIDRVEKSLDIRSKHGKNMKVAEIGKYFQSIVLDNEFSSTNLNFQPGSSSQLDIKLKFGNLKTGQGDVTYTSVIKAPTSSEYKGYFGEQNASSKINIVGKHGDIRLNFLD